MILPSWIGETMFWGLIAAIALLAYAMRKRALFCVASLGFLPFLPAGLRYLLADQTIALPSGSESIRVALVTAVSFLAVWGGFGAGLLFDWLNNGVPAAASDASLKKSPVASITPISAASADVGSEIDGE